MHDSWPGWGHHLAGTQDAEEPSRCTCCLVLVKIVLPHCRHSMCTQSARTE